MEPTFTVLTDMTEKIVSPFIDEPSQTGGPGQRRSRSVLKLESWGSGWSVHGDRLLLEGMGVVLLNHVHPISSSWHVSASSFVSEESKLYTLYSLGWPVSGWSRSRSWHTGSQYCPQPDPIHSLFWWLCPQHHQSLHFTCCTQRVLAPHTPKGKNHGSELSY